MNEVTRRYAPIECYLSVTPAKEALRFHEKAFGAEVTLEMPSEDGGRIIHANMKLYGGEVMLADEFPEFEGAHTESPSSVGAATAVAHFNVDAPEQVDRAVAKARDAGALVTTEAQDMVWRARYGGVKDPFGHVWAFAAALED